MAMTKNNSDQSLFFAPKLNTAANAKADADDRMGRHANYAASHFQ